MTDLQRHIAALLHLDPSQSNHRIARICNCTHPTVAKVRRRLTPKPSSVSPQPSPLIPVPDPEYAPLGSPMPPIPNAYDLHESLTYQVLHWGLLAATAILENDPAANTLAQEFITKFAPACRNLNITRTPPPPSL